MNTFLARNTPMITLSLGQPLLHSAVTHFSLRPYLGLDPRFLLAVDQITKNAETQRVLSASAKVFSLHGRNETQGEEFLG